MLTFVWALGWGDLANEPPPASRPSTVTPLYYNGEQNGVFFQMIFFSTFFLLYSGVKSKVFKFNDVKAITCQLSWKEYQKSTQVIQRGKLSQKDLSLSIHSLNKVKLYYCGESETIHVEIFRLQILFQIYLWSGYRPTLTISAFQRFFLPIKYQNAKCNLKE